MVDDRLIGMFIQETLENIEKLESDLVELEKDGTESGDVTDRIFRSFHTIKGMSASVGLEKISGMIHSMEELLSRIREGCLEPDGEVIDVLLASLDRLKGTISRMESGSDPEIEVSDLIEKAEKLSECGIDFEEVETEEKTECPMKTDKESAKDGGLINGHVKSSWEVTIGPECQLPSVRMIQLLSSLSRAGLEVSECNLEKEELESLKAGETVHLTITGGDAGIVEEILGSIAEIEYRRITGKGQKVTVGSGGNGRTNRTRSGTGKVGNEYIRIHVSKLDSLMNLVGELLIEEGRIRDIASRMDGRELSERLGDMKKTIDELQETVLSTRLMPLEMHFSRFPRLVRDLARELGKNVDLKMEGGDVELDRRILEKLYDPLVHILRNSVDHGIETPDERISQGKPSRGTISLKAEEDKGLVKIEVSDDGRGIDVNSLIDRAMERGIITAEKARKMDENVLLELVFHPGFSTSENVTEISGRGVGMDVVRSSVESIGGRVEIRSMKGYGTTVSLFLPLTLSIMGALIVSCSGTRFAIPLNSIEKVVQFSSGMVFDVKGRMMMKMDGEVIIVQHLPELFGLKTGVYGECEYGMGVIMAHKYGKICLLVESILEKRDIVVKPLGRSVRWRTGLAGSTISDNGGVMMIIDPTTIGAGIGGAAL